MVLENRVSYLKHALDKSFSIKKILWDVVIWNSSVFPGGSEHCLNIVYISAPSVG